jgi:alkaline phosphatase
MKPRFFRSLLSLSLVLAIAGGVFLPAMHVSAQDTAPNVLILPIDKAQFLPGATFDFRVEVHTDALPEDFAVTVNGQPASEFFGAEPTPENWEFGGRVASYVAEGTPGADFSLESLALEYYNSTFGAVAVTLDGDTLTGTIAGETVTLEATDDPLVFNVVGGAADGQVLTFGLNSDGNVTGFSVLGQNFGVLTSLPTKSQSVIWREVAAPAPGEYTVEVTAGGATTSATWTVREPQPGTAKNVILFIADGMSVPLITATRAVSRGIVQGTPNDTLAMEKADEVGLAHTSSVDSIMADSANTASSINTGHIGSVNATGSYSDTSPDTLDDPRVETLGEMLKRLRGMSIGIVTTADLSDATPAAVWAHGRNRANANRAAYLVQVLDLQPEVLMGGGSRFMLPQTAEGSRRSDDVDLFAEYEGAGYTIVTTASELGEAFSGGTPERLVGVFHTADMNVWLDRNVYTDNLGDFTDQPGLVDMTLAALEVLNQNPNGFYLEVEAASVDKQLHPLDQERTIADLIEFDNAIQAAIEWAAENAPDTLIVVTADHGHGYDVYGTVDVNQFNQATDDAGRRQAIRVYQNAKYPTYTDADGDHFPDSWIVDIALAGAVNNHPDYTENYQVSDVPRAPAIVNENGVAVDNPDDDSNGITLHGNLPPDSPTGVHTLQDVPVFAFGPGADFFDGTYHQREIFFGMAYALGLDPSAADGVAAAPTAAPARASTSTSGFNFPINFTTAIILLMGIVGGYYLGRRRQTA